MASSKSLFVVGLLGVQRGFDFRAVVGASLLSSSLSNFFFHLPAFCDSRLRSA